MIPSVLDIAGWKLMDEVSEERLSRHKRSIVVYNHTSGIMDFLICLIYRTHYTEILKDIKIIAGYYFTVIASNFVPNDILIAAPIPSAQKVGTVDKLRTELSKLDSFMYVVAPKGSTRPHQAWRRSFYILAKELNCAIVPSGLDFERKQFIAKEPFYVGDMTFDEVVRHCQYEMKDIVPMFPDRSEMPLDDYERPFHARTLEPWNFVMVIIIIVITITLIIIVIYLLYQSMRGQLFYIPEWIKNDVEEIT